MFKLKNKPEGMNITNKSKLTYSEAERQGLENRRWENVLELIQESDRKSEVILTFKKDIDTFLRILFFIKDRA